MESPKDLPNLPRLDIPPSTGPKPVLVSSPTGTLRSRESLFKIWSPTDGDIIMELPKPSFGASGKGFKGVRPPRPISKDPPRPMTASTKRLSFSSIASKRTIKYGNGKYSGVELAPQPSDDSEDPLNWPTWRKNLNFFSLIYMVSLVGVMKTIYISVNSNIAMRNGVSYTAAVALTAVPLMVSSLTGMASQVVSKVVGKRPVYLVSTSFMFVGVMWGMSVLDSYGQNMAARVFQGLGWGAFDTLVLGSLQDTFFDHELNPRVMVHNAVSVATTWGAPLLGGVASLSPLGFGLQFEILSCFFSVGVLLIVFGVPETTFDRASFSVAETTAGPSRPNWSHDSFSKVAAKDYLQRMKPWSYMASAIDSTLLLQAPRAVIAPTTMLLCLVSLLPYATLWGYASSLSLLFSVMPFMLSTSNMGALLAGPFLLASAVAVALSMSAFAKRFTPTVHVATLAAATTVASIGTLGFGLYIQGCMTMPTSGAEGTMWELNFIGAKLSFPVVSFLLGLLAAGSAAFDATVSPMIQRSTTFTSANLSICLRNTAHMNAGFTSLRNFVAGAFILAIPNAVWMWDGLKSAAIGLGMAQIFVAAAVTYVWWRWEENVRRLDGRLMGLVDLSVLKQQASFFDTS
ncbi:hypothetical protein JX265_003777 [Neoarthrinium moseri]|uniref:Major facilitator superfamily transporter n=1 Tax=Neoarthrinium moseri TaxID=1658444 RepID=A0A9P9WT73_9PEZI|nr:hypothetical protein JX266_009937 [Neoarthrinium moseri]KAI1877769.1 hypothetical protein JX265_003777 [Neoarthrinium moseri]